MVSFEELMKLEKIDDHTFRSVTRAYAPTGGQNGTYGGHVYAQAAWAAAQTVEDGFLLHVRTPGHLVKESCRLTRYYRMSPAGGFSAGLAQNTSSSRYKMYETAVITLHVLSLWFRNRKEVLCLQVHVHSKEQSRHHFNIKIEQTSIGNTQQHLMGRNHSITKMHQVRILNGTMLEFDILVKISFLNLPPRFHDVYLPSHPNHLNPLPGLHLRKVDMTAYNTGREPIDKRQLTFYSIRGGLPSPYSSQPSNGNSKTKSITREANLHAIAHLYASDRNSLFIVPNHLELGREYTRMASLSHTVIFHVGIEDMAMSDEPPEDDPRAFPTAKESRRGEEGTKRKWYMQESWITRAEGGRGLHTTRLWDPERGVHLASTMQDGLVRFKPGARLKL